MSRTYDVAIVGSGIVGLGAAYAAATRGQRVIVIDRASEPMGATVRNFGHLCIGAQTGVARAYADASRPLWLQLSRDAGFWLRESGTLVVARHDDELRLLEAAARDGGIEMLGAADIERHTPVRPDVAIGGARVVPDLQTDPRAAGPAIRAYLASLGVEFLLRTSVGRVATGLVQTTRGDIRAGLVVVAVNHDVDQLLPDLADAVGVQRCGLDMLRVRAEIPALGAPLLTGWSLVRYGRFAALPEASVLRHRLHGERPDLAAIDINQMYTQLPDGSFIVGDTHAKGAGIPPFQSEAAADLMLDEFRALFGGIPRVIERWQGIYATGPDEFLVDEPETDVVVLAATTGIGMTTGLGLAETTLAPRLGTRLSSRADATTYREGTLR